MAIALGEKRPQLHSLTGLRALGMLLVFVVHGSFEIVFSDDTIGLAYLEGVGTSGQTAVTYFFILTGFVLTWSWNKKESLRAFWRRRAVRVFPNHVTALAFAVVLIIALGALPDFLPLLANLFLVQSWFPDPAFQEAGNSATWSLAVDIGFYALFPFLLPLVKRIRSQYLWYVVGAVAVVIALIPVVANTFLPATPESPLWQTSESRYWFVYFFPLSRMLECLLGMLVARILITGRWIGLRPLPAALILVAAYVAAQQVPFLYRYAAITAVPVALLTAALATMDVEGRKSWLNSKALVRLGELSFAFYLLHGPILKYGHLMFGTVMDGGIPEGRTWEVPGALAFLVGMFAVSLVLAWLMNVFVEQKAVRLWSRRKTPAAPRVKVAA
ncbi:acyltransferase [Streptomyces sp. NBC_00237]|uniref:acyltransferase family protein n=1 Tax=Streptomyces sp. NBC_00237 TaxID=2975687 RepID=UPI00224F55A9|nr:acyltransferase [Streptomyces sp. NBC_00237]MCX5206945.1 acyltransferase [Streptomyces sp. NBC_00237]